MARVSKKMRGLVFEAQEDEDTPSQDNISSVNHDVNAGSDGKAIWIRCVDGSRRKMRERPTVSDVFGLQQGEKILVDLGERGCPNNYAGYLLGAFLADLARTGTECPIHIQRWDYEAFNSYKKNMMKTVEKKFKFHVNGRSWVLDRLHEAWRAHKTTLKGKYFDRKSLEEILKNVTKEAEATQWSSLVCAWSTTHEKKESQTNSENARKQVHYHTGGRKSIARKRKEMIDENDGKEPDRLTLWDETHKRKDA